MGNMSKLLNKPFKAFTIYALVILACSIPVYYWVVDFIWLNELDEHNQIIKERLEEGFDNVQIEEGELKTLLDNWNKLQPGTTLLPLRSAANITDSIYTITRFSDYGKHQEVDRFRGLSSYIRIKGKSYHLQVETNVEEADETMLAITIVTMLFFILLVAGFIVLNKRLARKIWQPFRSTLEKLKLFDLTARQTISFDTTDIEEFAALNQSLKKLIDKNISVYNQQKTFIENASHELQTPLAVLKSKIGMLLQNKHMTGEQSEILSAIELPIARMTRINKNLLLLAKIENNQFAGQENLELTEVVEETLDLLFDYITAKQITIDKRLEEKQLLTCNKTLLEILISNLLINAIIHNTEPGSIDIRFSTCVLAISNTGKAALNEEKLFERFVVSSSETTNSGLGLAIVKEICNRYGWQIHYTFQKGHHLFEVHFAVSK
jgi:signal transduction histidine kinase